MSHLASAITTRLRKGSVLGVSALIALGAAALDARALSIDTVIDNYETTQVLDVGEYFDGNDPFTASRATISNPLIETILGGDREMTLECFSDDGTTLFPTAAANDPDDTCTDVDGARFRAFNGSLRLSNADSVISRGRVLWDGFDGTTPTDPGINDHGLGGVDLTAPDADAFLMNVLSADGDFFLVFDVWSGTGASAEQATIQWRSEDIRDILLEAPPSTVVPIAVPFAWFTTPGLYDSLFPAAGFSSTPNAAIDFTSVSAIQLTVWGRNVSVDFGIGAFGTTTSIPEPATIGLLGLAALGAGAWRRRR